MKILEYIEKTEFNKKSEAERVKLVCYYSYKEFGCSTFSMSEIVEKLVDFGCNKPNLSRLKEKLLKGKNKGFVNSKLERNKIEFILAVKENLDKQYGGLWSDTETILSASELIDETKFCGKREYITKIIKQINEF